MQVVSLSVILSQTQVLTEELESVRADRVRLLSENKASKQAHTEEVQKLQCRASSLREERDQLQDTLEGLREEKRKLRAELEESKETLQAEVCV